MVELYDALRPYIDAFVEARQIEAAEDVEGEESAEGPMKLAIIGRPNAGNSTLINQLLGQERLITGPEAGITRDSISIDWEWAGRTDRQTDTAGCGVQTPATRTSE